MSGADTQANRFRQWLQQQPGKRGVDIPAAVFDKIFPVANGITQPLWGRPPTPHQLQWLFDNGHHTPQAIHEAFAQLPHPQAPSLKVGEYATWKDAYATYRRYR